MKLKQNLMCLTLVAFSLCNLTAQADTTIETTPRIVGGQVSTPGQWPWMMALVVKGLNPFAGQFCGGSLITSTWVVTAAHCVAGETANTIEVVAHLFDLKNDIGQTVAIKRIVRHPDYKPKTSDNDIALLELQEPVSNTPVLPLVVGTDPLAHITSTIIGWGALSESDSNNGIYPELLYETTVPIVSNFACKISYGSDAITKNMLCAGLNKGGKDTCQGDSGGPLIVQQNGQWRLAGITSTGLGCARPHYYGIYTRVSRYVNYINRTIATNFAALADVNHDAVVDMHDQRQKNTELLAGFQNWVDQCWTSHASCGDVNADGTINQRDYDQQKKTLADEFKQWLTVDWQPEAS